MSKVSPIPIENLSFAAYRLPMSEGEYGAPAAFISLAQWFEAEKFRPFHRELFDQVMLAPTISSCAPARCTIACQRSVLLYGVLWRSRRQ